MATDTFKDYYHALGVDRTASAEQIKRAYRKLARKYHPDVSKEPDAENQFKAVAEAHAALIDPERRAAYDDLAARHARGETGPPPGWDGYEFSGRSAGAGRGSNGSGGHSASDAEFSDFFESLFGRGAAAARGGHGAASAARPSGGVWAGADHHARIELDLTDAFTGARHTVSLRRPVRDAHGHTAVHDRQLEVNIPPGVRPGQHLRLAGLGEPGEGGGPAGDLYLEIGFRPHAQFRVDGADLWFDLPVAPWEAALGATVPVATPLAELQLNIPAGSSAGRKLRLKGKGLPGKTPGDLYAVLQVALPPADNDAARSAYAALAQAFAGFEPRPRPSHTATAA